MAAISFFVFVSLFFLGYFTRNKGGIPLPFKEKCEHEMVCWKRLDLWRFTVGDEAPQEASTIIMKNIVIWLVVYTFAHVLTHVEPQRKLFRPFKFNPNYPSISLVRREFIRSVRGVLIGSMYEILINNQHRRNNLPAIDLPNIFQLNCHMNENGTEKICDLNLFGFFVASIAVYFWSDFHFYWTHRMLHTKWLYRNVHKIHHESFNPDPFSGLSMHWFESSVYFSAAPLVAFILPLHSYRLLTLGLIIFPLGGHSGFGSWESEPDFNHYIHHSKFNWNYGSSPLWDHLMGTNYTSKQTSSSTSDYQRSKEAEEQAYLVGAAIGNDMKDSSVENNDRKKKIE